ncbi:MAG TPA: winged helix-turn-helix domain-containing protein [Terriglobales bacterium]|nr:winged helix-turn-helix domain-containing protein [Terriglobales bacterium]
MDSARPSPRPSPRHFSRHLGFGVYELDLHAGELRKLGVKVKLQPKPLALLAILLENPGEVVTREELRNRLWADTFVDEHGLSNAVNKVRLALSDTAENPRFVETLAKRGYRFIAPVRRPAEKEPSGKAMIAVLPFANPDGDPKNEYFVDGMTDEMISSLAATNPQRLGVIARTSAMRYKNAELSLEQVARELRVEYVLEGSVRRTARKVRISARLIQSSDQMQTWANTYESAVKDVLTLQADVAAQIAKALAVELIPENKKRMQRPATGSFRAYDLYMKGRYHWSKRTEAGFQQALESFYQAAEIDPGYALANAGIADCYAVFGFYGFLSPREAYEKAKAFAKRALESDSRLPEAHSTLAFATLQYDWDWPAAEKGHRHAMALNENYAPAHHWYGIDLTQMGMFHDALTELRVAERLDPFASAVQAQIGWLFYFSRDFGRAMEQLQRTVEADPSFALARYFLGMAYTQSKDHAAAVRELKEAVEQTESHPACVAALAAALQCAGKPAEARKAVKQLDKLAEKRHVSPYYMAFARSGNGEADDIVPWLEKAFAEKSGWMLYLKIEPAFDAVRADPRIRALLAQVDPLRGPAKAKKAGAR